MAIRLFPFNGGIENSVDIRLLPDGLLADAVNVELDRQGRLVVRPGFTSDLAHPAERSSHGDEEAGGDGG